MEKKINKINKIFPWFSGLSTDLIFYIAINTLWLTNIKDFSAAQITFLTTIGSLFAIFFQPLALAIIKRIGNTNSIRVGSASMLISSILLTISKEYIFFAIASIFLEIALIFNAMGEILIKNNLNYQNKGNEYISISSKASIIYAVSTAIIATLIGIIFNIHNYLPMILGIVTNIICLILSFFIFDVDDVKKISAPIEKKKGRRFPQPFKLSLISAVLYGLLWGLIVISQSNGKLIIQYQMNESLSVEKVATYLGIILLTSRLFRVLVNYLYPKIYKKYGDTTGLILTGSIFTSLSLILLGFYINAALLLKVIIMTIGFSFIPALRDPVKIYIQNMILEKFDKQYHKEMFSYLSLFRHIGKFTISIIVSTILLKATLQYVFIVLLVGSLPLIYLSLSLKKEIMLGSNK